MAGVAHGINGAVSAVLSMIDSPLHNETGSDGFDYRDLPRFQACRLFDPDKLRDYVASQLNSSSTPDEIACAICNRLQFVVNDPDSLALEGKLPHKPCRLGREDPSDTYFF